MERFIEMFLASPVSLVHSFRLHLMPLPFALTEFTIWCHANECSWRMAKCPFKAEAEEEEDDDNNDNALSAESSHFMFSIGVCSLRACSPSPVIATIAGRAQ